MVKKASVGGQASFGMVCDCPMLGWKGALVTLSPVCLPLCVCVCVCACVCVCVCVCVCGTALFAGGTPNLSNNVRAIPQSQFVPAWYRVRFTRTLPHELYTSLSLHAQKICREIVASPSGPAVPAAAYFRFPPDKENGTDPGQGQGGRLVVPKL